MVMSLEASEREAFEFEDAPVSEEETQHMSPTGKRGKRRKLKLLSNILDDLGLSEVQKAVLCACLLVGIVGGRLYFGLPVLPAKSPRRRQRKYYKR